MTPAMNAFVLITHFQPRDRRPFMGTYRLGQHRVVPGCKECGPLIIAVQLSFL